MDVLACESKWTSWANRLSGRDGSVLIKYGSESGSDRYNVCSKVSPG